MNWKSDTHTRSFGGKIKDFKDKLERDFEKAHLKAYLKGKKSFRFRYRTLENGISVPNYFEVKENWTPIS